MYVVNVGQLWVALIAHVQFETEHGDQKPNMEPMKHPPQLLPLSSKIKTEGKSYFILIVNSNALIWCHFEKKSV